MCQDSNDTDMSGLGIGQLEEIWTDRRTPNRSKMAKIAKIEKSGFLSPTTRRIAFPLANQNVIFDAKSNGVLCFPLAITVFEIQGSRHENTVFFVMGPWSTKTLKTSSPGLFGSANTNLKVSAL